MKTSRITAFVLVLTTVFVASAYMEDYTLVQNLTFNNVPISSFTTSGSTWNMTNGSNCRTGDCLVLNQSVAGFYYAQLPNGTWNRTADTGFVVKCWAMDNEPVLSDAGWPSIMLNRQGNGLENYDSVGFMAHSDGPYRFLHNSSVTTGAGASTTQNSTSGGTDLSNLWWWLVVNYSRETRRVDVKWYNTSNEAQLFLAYDNITTARYATGGIGFFARRSVLFDDCEYWTQEPALVQITASTYNVTSGTGNTTIWRVNRSIAVNTTDPTPTVTFITGVTSNCSIGRSDWNYSVMVANDSDTKCGTVDTINMTCTLPSTKALTSGSQNLYLSCVGANGAQSNTSTSGALNITWLAGSSIESLARTTIETAANNVLVNPGIYTNQQVYLRRVNGTQQLATFDKVVVYGTQRWAINYLTGSDTYTGIKNLTPVLYVYESTNMTMSQLQTDIETLFTSTKS